MSLKILGSLAETAAVFQGNLSIFLKGDEEGGIFLGPVLAERDLKCEGVIISFSC